MTKSDHRLLYALANAIMIIALIAGSRVEVATQSLSLDAELNQRRADLLKTYNDWKNYGPNAPALATDREAVFEAIIRALFVEFEKPLGTPTGIRPIHYLKEVRGIWGYRLHETEGDQVFRLSVVWDTGVIAKLDDAENFSGHSSFAHVLLPVKKDGDDKRDRGTHGSGARTWRQRGTPSIQISILPDGITGEVDLDFDEKTRYEFPHWCHTQPSNSDVGSEKGTRKHVENFQLAYGFFSTKMPTNWSSTKHCQDAY